MSAISQAPSPVTPIITPLLPSTLHHLKMLTAQPPTIVKQTITAIQAAEAAAEAKVKLVAQKALLEQEAAAQLASGIDSTEPAAAAAGAGEGSLAGHGVQAIAMAQAPAIDRLTQQVVQTQSPFWKPVALIAKAAVYVVKSMQTVAVAVYSWLMNQISKLFSWNKALKTTEIPFPSFIGNSSQAPSQIATSTSERIQLLTTALFQNDSSLTDFAEQRGYESMAAFAVAHLQQSLWEDSTSKVDTQNWWMVGLLPEASAEEAALSQGAATSSVIGTVEAPGPMALMIRARLDAITQNPPAEWIDTDKDKAAWPKKVAKFAQTWATFEARIRSNPKAVLFDKDPIIRQLQYEGFAKKLFSSFQELVKTDRDSLWFSNLADFMPACHTAWKEGTDQLSTMANLGYGVLDHSMSAQLVARNLRREILLLKALPEVAKAMHRGSHAMTTDVHYQLAAKQWGNKPLALGYPEAYLSGDEAILAFFNQASRLPAASKAALQSHYTSSALLSNLESYFKGLTEDKQEAIRESLLDSYKEGLLKGSAPFLDQATHIAKLFQAVGDSCLISDPHLRLEALRKNHQALLDAEIVNPGFSCSTLRESIIAQLKATALSGLAKLALNSTGKPSTEVAKQVSTHLEQKVASLSEEELIEVGLTKEELAKIAKLLAELSHSEEDAAQVKQHADLLFLAKKSATSAPLYIAEHNKKLLAKRLFDNDGQLRPFGLQLWAYAAKLMQPLTAATDATADQLLKWAHHFSPFSLTSDQFIKKLEKHPQLYPLLPDSTKALPALIDLVKIHPGLRYGISDTSYYSYLHNPVQSLSAGPKWVGECKAIVMAAVQVNGLLLHRASNTFKAQKEIVLLAVKNNGKALAFASPTLLLQKEIVLLAIQQNGLALEHALNMHKADLKMVQIAVNQNPSALAFADPSLLSNMELVLPALAKDGSLLLKMRALQSNEQAVLLALKTYPSALAHANNLLRHSPIFVKKAIAINPLAIAGAARHLRGTKEIAMLAVQGNGLALQYVSDDLKNDTAIVTEAILQNPKAIEFASAKLKTDSSIQSILKAKEVAANQQLIALHSTLSVLPAMLASFA